MKQQTKTEAKKPINLEFPFDLPTYMAISIADRRPSSYILEADGERGDDVAIDTCDKMLKRISDVQVWDPNMNRWVTRQIRFLKGCSSIWVSEQEEMNYVSRNPGSNAVWLKSGGLGFSVEGDNIQMAMFIMLHENNATFKELEGRFKRPESAQDVFFQVETEANASKEVVQFLYEEQAKSYLKRLVDQRGKELSYNEDLLQFLSDLFKLPATEEGTMGAEVFTMLLTLANEDPKQFLSKIGNYEGVVEADVNRALSTGVIEVAEANASFRENGKNIISFDNPRASDSEKHRLLMEFFLNPRNRGLYDLMRSLSVGSQAKQTSLITE